MSLPEIPQEAAWSAHVALHTRWPGERPSAETTGCGDCMDDIEPVLAAAWPHLYATALRHAADDLDQRQTPDNRHVSERDAALWLHHMADGAGGGSSE